MSTRTEEQACPRDEASSTRTQDWKLQHVKGDLFSCPADESLAHCISEDCRMGAGIAVLFKKKFGRVEELKDQNYQKKYSHKPTYDSLRKSLLAMKNHCLENGVTRISMPRIGCGLDGLSWHKVEVMIEEVFCDTDICITVYTLGKAC